MLVLRVERPASIMCAELNIPLFRVEPHESPEVKVLVFHVLPLAPTHTHTHVHTCSPWGHKALQAQQAAANLFKGRRSSLLANSASIKRQLGRVLPTI